MDTITAGFMLMGYGLGSVFLALIVFYASIRILTGLCRERPEKEKKEG